jgi:hypothetical protein
VDLGVSFWFDSSKTSGDRLKSALISRIKDELLASGFHIPDVAREIVFADALKIHLLKTVEEADQIELDRQRSATEKATEELKQNPCGKVGKGSENQDIRNLGNGVSLLRKTNDSDLLKVK